MKRLIFIATLICLSLLSIKLLYSKNSSTYEFLYKENIVSIAHVEKFRKLEYGRILFKHKLHVDSMAKILNKTPESVCSECHQKNQYGEYSFDFIEDLHKKEAEEIKNLYHAKCLDCHKNLSAQRKKTGPEILSCRDCHKKENENRQVKYPLVEFDFYLHNKHVTKHKKDCSLCHHSYDLKEDRKELALFYEPGTEASCYYCHDFSKKRGPELTKIVNVAKQKGLNLEKSFHLLCINCHLESKNQDKDRGPIVCAECHTGKYRALEELKEVSRPEVNQPKRAFLSIEGAKMKGVSFRHDFHEMNNKNCRICHHETLRACKDCHDLKGKEEGGFVNIATAYHSLSSTISCQGCHGKLKEKVECMSCHYFIPPVKIQIAPTEICNKCHTGKRDFISTKIQNFKNVPQEVIIKHLEEDFEAVKMPHLRMIQKLNEISNRSNLANYFHGSNDTICRGCHHKSKEEAEAQREKPPLCISCHGSEFSSKDIGKPRLQSAYHGMCIKCHETLKLEKPKKCTDCHERKVKKNVYN